MAHILVIDDEYPIRFLIRKVLEAAGHHIFEAGSAHEALDILETHPDPFDMIVLDIRMPHMDGFELLPILRRQPVSTHIPIIIASAHTDTIPKALEPEISGYLPKPFARQKLLDMVNNALMT
ncbi:MAG: response regulator [Chloroflexota bacterium]